MPGWLRRTLAYCLVVIAVVAVGWLVVSALLSLGLVAFTVTVAVLLTSLLWPLTSRLRRVGLPPALASLVALVLLVGLPSGIGLLLWARISDRFHELATAVTQGIDQIHTWLTTGPLNLSDSRVDALRDQLVGYVNSAMPSPVAGARTVLLVLAGLVLALFTVFFLLKDGPSMWTWLLHRVPDSSRRRVDGVGRRAWSTLTAYVVGVTAVALIDAVLIGLGLLLLGVPLWFTLSLLIFVTAYVPIIGATVSGAVAVLVTLATNGFVEALIALGVVLVVQQIEGNVLQPVIMQRAVHLHPVVTVVGVTAGTILLGIPGALLAVPVIAVAYGAAEYLRTDAPP
ncbi:MAG TPA: AI-2E family transporter [Nocardioidaceae bacterium]|nr:AI-2E family transporter [Nocardioidaceae bacterium]